MKYLKIYWDSLKVHCDGRANEAKVLAPSFANSLPILKQLKFFFWSLKWIDALQLKYLWRKWWSRPHQRNWSDVWRFELNADYFLKSLKWIGFSWFCCNASRFNWNLWRFFEDPVENGELDHINGTDVSNWMRLKCLKSWFFFFSFFFLFFSRIMELFGRGKTVCKNKREHNHLKVDGCRRKDQRNSKLNSFGWSRKLEVAKTSIAAQMNPTWI